MTPEEIEHWKSRIEIARLKIGKTLKTAILHIEGADQPPEWALFSAANEWQGPAPGQITRRPDEAGKQVYWVNVLLGYT